MKMFIIKLCTLYKDPDFYKKHFTNITRGKANCQIEILVYYGAYSDVICLVIDIFSYLVY